MNSRLGESLAWVEETRRELLRYAAQRARLPHIAKTNLSWAAIDRKRADVVDAEAEARAVGATEDQITIANRQAETR